MLLDETWVVVDPAAEFAPAQDLHTEESFFPVPIGDRSDMVLKADVVASCCGYHEFSKRRIKLVRLSDLRVDFDCGQCAGRVLAFSFALDARVATSFKVPENVDAILALA
jgi:hypothetical protein